MKSLDMKKLRFEGLNVTVETEALSQKLDSQLPHRLIEVISDSFFSLEGVNTTNPFFFGNRMYEKLVVYSNEASHAFFW